MHVKDKENVTATSHMDEISVLDQSRDGARTHGDSLPS
jgi:hypothetical protein